MHGEVQFVHYLKQSRQAFCSLHILILTNFLLWYTPDTTSLTPHIHLFSPNKAGSRFKIIFMTEGQAMPCATQCGLTRERMQLTSYTQHMYKHTHVRCIHTYTNTCAGISDDGFVVPARSLAQSLHAL